MQTRPKDKGEESKMPTLHSILRYPVKGFPAEELANIDLKTGEGLPDDRRYAITNGISNAQGGAWLPCRSFFINAVNDGLLRFANESDGQTICLASPGGARISWKKGDPESLKLANRKMAEFIAPLLPAHDLPVPVVTERTQKSGSLSGYWDFTDSAVSIMNIASLEAVAKAAGTTLDHRRLRGNLYLDNLPPWEEFSWLGKRIRIGQDGPELEILRPVQRCPATSVNPETGLRDFKVPDALTDHFGHAYCGMYAKVVKSGAIQKGAEITLIGEAETPFAEAANPDDTPVQRWPKMAEVVSREPTASAVAVSIRASGPWALPEANSGQRMRFHIGQDLIGVATVHEHRDHTTVLHVAPSETGDPATSYLLEMVKPGDRLIVSGPFGRG